MLISLSPFGDLSRYVQEIGGMKIHNTIFLIIDSFSIPCSGLLLAARSKLLEQMVTDAYEIRLDGFSGVLKQIYQVG